MRLDITAVVGLVCYGLASDASDAKCLRLPFVYVSSKKVSRKKGGDKRKEESDPASQPRIVKRE